MNKPIDISVALNTGIPCWPGSPGFSHHWVKSFRDGDGFNASMLSMDLHFGTHVDAPLHFHDGGAAVDELNLEILCGPAQVVECGAVEAVSAAVLAGAGIDEGTIRVLLKTRNSPLWKEREFNRDYAALTDDAAHWLLDRGVRLVGIDYLSVQRFSDPPVVHSLLLAAGVVLLEGLDLSQAPAGCYELLCLPLRISGAEGAPARAILRELR